MSTLARLCRSVLLLVFAASIAPVMHAQQLLRVPQDYSSIQAAIDAAHSGDTVSVGPGTYFVNLTLDTKEITVISTDGSATTILDGGHLGPVLRVLNTSGIKTLISGFTVQNGSPLGSAPSSLSVGPAGVLIANAGAQIANSTFQKNTGINVGVINGSLTLTASSISTASSSGSCALSSGSGAIDPSSGVYLSGTSTVLSGQGVPVPSGISGTIIFGDGTRCSGSGIQAVNFGQPLTIQSNTIRNNYLGVSVQATQLLLIQNLIYDNVTGGLSLNSPSAPPNLEPITTFVINNTVVNNLTSPDPATPGPTDFFLDGTVARTALVNNILVGTSPHPVLTCATATPSLNKVPLVFDHNDLYNTTNASNSTLSGDCLTLIGGSPDSALGNLSVDPRLTGSTDLHPLAGSPVIDAGNNSAPGLLFDAFSLASGTVTTNSPLLTDLAGNRRITDATGRGTPVVDMGAYEANGSLLLRPTASVVFAMPSASLPGFTALSGYTIAANGVHPAGTITFLGQGALYGPQTPGSDGIARGEISTFGPGVYSFQARSNLSDPAFAPSTSTVVYTLVTEDTTTLSIAASAGPQVTTEPLKLTVHLGSLSSDSTTPGPVPPGVVYLDQDGSLLSTLQPDSTGLATYTLPHPPAGSHTYSVLYEGNGAYTFATASTSVLTTSPAATSLSASASPTPAALGQAVTFSASVIANTGTTTPTGSVTFTDGATLLGSAVILTNGSASITTSALSFGVHTITVTYSPDPAFSPSSGTTSVNVGGINTTTALTTAVDPAIAGTTVPFTVTVTNSGATSSNMVSPLGAVTLTDGETLIASGVLTASASGSSVVTLSASFSTAGSHPLTATYIPATSATIASTGTLSETITAAPVITTVLSVRSNPTNVGATVVLSAIVTSAAALPSSAMVFFFDGATTLGSVPLVDGLATLPVNTLSIGTHQLLATVRTPDVAAARSISNMVAEQINGLASTLVLAAAPTPSVFATAPVTLTATLSTGPLPAGSQFSGTVIFFDGPAPLGSAAVDTTGRATLSNATLTTGTHTLTATFSGNSLLAAAPAPAIVETVLPNPSVTSLSVAPSSTSAFQSVTVAAHVFSATSLARVNTLTCSPACTPIVVTFFADTSEGRSTLGIAPVDSAGNADLVITPAVGTYSISAAFSGSPLFGPSVSPASILTVTPAITALTLSANPNPVYQHGAITLNAALTAPGISASALSGTVSFLEGSTPLGTVTLAAAQSFAYTPETVGPHTLTAVFSGSGSLLRSSAAVTITVLPSDFILSLKDSTLTIATTHHAPTSISVTAVGSLADRIDVSCANLPQNAHCTFAPPTHDLTDTNASSGLLTLDTDALLDYARARPATPESGPNVLTAVLTLCLPTSFLAGLVRLRRRGRLSPRCAMPQLLAALLLSITAVTLSGCNGLYPPHVTPGSYTITITGHARSSGIEHTANITLVVTQ